MPLNDSPQTERTERELQGKQTVLQGATPQEDIVTPIEAEIQARVERDFEKPPAHKKAIVSVNGEDVAEVPVTPHDRAA